MSSTKRVVAALAAALSIAAFAGCQKPEGPAEQAGKVVDRAVEKAGQQMEKAGEGLQDAAKGSNSR